MTLGFCLVTNINALWVKVLRSKYRLKDNLPESIMANNGSFLSKVLLKIWPLFRDNLICLVGLAPNSKGNFLVKSAYWSPKEDYWNPKDPMWKTSWNFKGPQRVLLLLWLTFKERLLTNMEHVRRGIGQEASYPGILDGLTLLQDCGLNKISIHTDRLERLRKFEHWMVRHAPREANLVVDRITNMVVVDMEGVNVLAIAPTDPLEALQSDKDNGPFDCTSVV
ncbi:hypothetical protein Gotri_018836 [Gossypium trilobum]|uniref:Reverse transcriptase zinc-binding domain-containing protein n=1 Tax=Gossypium trilobum TaxID=34281 RepID=A0A7J9EBH0_9ROSI|nr:hypothetical protein [Gossypium trilobum]